MRMAATMDTGFDALANAIIERAANDYITAQRKLAKGKRHNLRSSRVFQFRMVLFAVKGGWKQGD